MFNIAIVDNEYKYLNYISELLFKTSYYEDIEIYKFTHPEKLLRVAEDVDFHLVFMETNMGKVDGIAFVHKHFLETPIIYVSQHKERIEECIAHNVYRFVCKKNLEAFFQNDFGKIYLCLKESCIQIHHNRQLLLLNIQDIMYVKYVQRNVIIHTQSQCYTMKRMSLKHFVNHYQYDFLAVNKNTYINWKYIQEVSKEQGVTLKGLKERFWLSSYRYYRFVQVYKQRRGGRWLE